MQIRTCQTCRATFEQARGYPAKRCPGCRTEKRMAPVTFTIPVRCPSCEAPTEPINQRSLKGELVALVKCTAPRCGRQWLVKAFLAPLARDEQGDASRCGTEAGAQRHFRAKEKACEACLRAHSEAIHDRDKRKSAA